MENDAIELDNKFMEETAQKPIENGLETTKPVEEPVVRKQTGSHNRFFKISIILVIVISIVLAGYFGSKLFFGAKTTEEIVIGYLANQTNPGTSSFGIAARQGFELAVDEINAKGGLLGRKIKPVIFDDKADADISRKDMEQLVLTDKAIAVVGPANSGSALNWLDLAQDNETIVLVPIATATEITQRYKDRPRNFIFRDTSLDRDQITLYVSWIVNKTHNGKIAIIHDSTPYGVNGEKDVANALSRWGKIPTLVASFDRGISITDMAKMIRNAKAAGVDGICFFGLADSTADFLKAMDLVPGYKPKITGTAAAGDPLLWKLAGKSSENLIFATGKDLNADYSAFEKKLEAKFPKKTTTTPGSATASYDLMNFLADAINKAGVIDREKIQESLENLSDVKGVFRTFKKPFTHDRHEAFTLDDLGLVHWKDGKLVLEDSLKLEIR